ncbi:MAG: cation:proton antiporter [Lachnotalea sp.]
MGNSDLSLYSIPAIILFVGIVSSKLSKWLRLPDIVLYLIAGVIIGPTVLNIATIETYSSVNQFILTFGAAFILYDGGREIKLKVLREIKLTVLLLVTLGVILSMVIVGFFAAFIFKLPLIYGLLIGAVIASTDPAVLVPIFQNINIVKRVKQTIISESAFNDAIGAVLVLTILLIIKSGTFSMETDLIDLLKMIGFGAISGVLVGLFFSGSVSNHKFSIFTEFAPIVSLIVVLASYTLAEAIGGSGYMSAFIAGLMCGNKKQFNLWVPDVEYEIQTHVRETVVAIMKIAIFIVLGMHVDFAAIFLYWKEGLMVVFVLVFVARPLSVLICTKLDRKLHWKKNEILFMMWVRETGVIPAALSSAIVSSKIPHAEILSAVVFLTIGITLLMQATTTTMLARKLDLIIDEPVLESTI